MCFFTGLIMGFPLPTRMMALKQKRHTQHTHRSTVFLDWTAVAIVQLKPSGQTYGI